MLCVCVCCNLRCVLCHIDILIFEIREENLSSLCYLLMPVFVLLIWMNRKICIFKFVWNLVRLILHIIYLSYIDNNYLFKTRSNDDILNLEKRHISIYLFVLVFSFSFNNKKFQIFFLINSTHQTSAIVNKNKQTTTKTMNKFNKNKKTKTNDISYIKFQNFFFPFII